jgi:hypothetical protein
MGVLSFAVHSLGLIDCLSPALSWLADSVGGIASTASSPEPTPLPGSAAGMPSDTLSSTPLRRHWCHAFIARCYDVDELQLYVYRSKESPY